MKTLVLRFLSSAALVLCCAFFMFSRPAAAAGNDIPAGWKQLIENSDIKNAELAAQAVLKDTPGSYEAHELLAVTSKLQGKYDEMFEHCLELFKHDRVENVLYADGFIYRDLASFKSVWLSPGQLSRLEKALNDMLVSKKASDPAVVNGFRETLAHLYVESGRLDKARQIADTTGFLKDWLIIGSFDNKENMGFYEAYPPEKEIDLNKEYDGIRWKIKWRKLKSVRFDNGVDMENALQPNDWSVGYALTYIYSPEERDAALRLGADDAVKAWFNDKLIIEDETAKRCMYDQHSVGVKLHKGWNKLLIKLCQNEGAWIFAARLTGAAGNIFNDLAFSLDPSVYTPFTDTADNKVIAHGAEAYFRSILDKNPSDTLARYHLARWYRNTDMREKAIMEYEELVKANPDCALFRLEAGIAYFADDKPSKGLAAFRKAEELNPDAVEIQFRLGRYYYGERLYKKAEAKMKKCIELNPKLPEPYLHLAHINENEKRFDESYKYGKQALSCNPYMSSALNNTGWYAEKKGYQGEADKYYKGALARQFTNHTARHNLIDGYKRKNNYGAAIKEFEAILKLYDVTGYYLDIADCYLTGKKYDEAARWCRKALDVCPENYAAHSKLGVIAYQTGKTDEAKKHWDTALSYKPDYVWLREYMKTLFPSQNAVFDKYAVKDEERDSIIKNAPDKKDYPEAEAIILLDQDIMQVNADGSYSEMAHRIVKITGEGGRGRFGTANLPNSETLKIKKAVTIKPDGDEIEPTLIQNGKISFASVDEGSIVEYQFTLDRYSAGWLKNQYYDSFYFQWGEGPAVKSQFILALPEDKELKTSLRGENVGYSEDSVDGNKVRVWTAENSAQIYREDLKPPFEDISSRLLVSTIPSWEYLSKWENSLIVDQFKTDNKLRDKIQELTKDSVKLDDKIRALYNYVMDDVRYLQGASGGMFGVKPHKAVNVFADEYGVCKDKAVLLVAMLREIGVDAYYALVLTRDSGRVARDLPYPRFNHAMVYITPKAGPGYFVDATSPYLEYRALWPHDEDVDAMVIRNGGYEFVKTPVNGSDKNSAMISVKARIDSEGDLSAQADETAFGFFSSMIRWTYEIEGRRKEILEGNLNKDLPGAQLDEFNFTDLKDMNMPVKVSYKYTAPSFARKDGRKMYFKTIDQFKMTEWLAKKSDRKYDIRLPYLYSQLHRQEFKLPRGWSVASLPENRIYENELARYSSAFTVKAGSVICEKEMALKSIEIKKSDYRKLREFCVKADSDDMREVIIEKTGK